ncbi:MAG: PPC domain-containing DNA-binding protein [Minisyncoccia bacterium]
MLLLIGALKKIKFAYYNQLERRYLEKEINSPVEILSCLGNITKKENELFLHLHITIADKNGNAFGGHLLKGSIVFALEGIIFEFFGKPIKRKFDESIKLFLFDI